MFQLMSRIGTKTFYSHQFHSEMYVLLGYSAVYMLIPSYNYIRQTEKACYKLVLTIAIFFIYLSFDKAGPDIYILVSNISISSISKSVN